MDKLKYMIWSIACLMLLTQCGEPADDSTTKVEELNSGILYWDMTKASADFAYDIGEPAAIFELPNKLTEISGLSISQDEQSLYCVQDELGNIFELNIRTGEVIAEMPFGKNGDYEGIERVGDRYYAVKSSGTIYEIEHIQTDTQNVIKYNEGLSSKNDVEGLAYDAKNNRLLLACKESAGIDTVYDMQKAYL